ncbi:clostripain-related cysteine peptidase [Sphingobacterium sp. LRF_L2]|uniref:clostripain-related cysteine peptidase n=1 Tax=Sphingobacterium sp. LRF_L2 TaxID=3369421 RepID=UPI003F5E8632
MAANNSLNGDAYTNINQMERAYQGINGTLLVYARLKNSSPAIYAIQHDTGSEIASTVIKTYNEHNSSDPEIMSMVISDMEALVPAASYGLVLWSHATSWHPDPTIKLKSFGDDAGETMDIQDLKTALPPNLDFLLFDACSMASVEVLYELKGNARYTVASPAEVISVGMPYDKMLANLFDEDLEAGLESAAKAYYDYYQAQTGLYQSATISVIDNDKLDILASAVSSFLAEYQHTWTSLIRDEIQRLDFAEGSPTAGFDLLDFYTQNFPEADLQDLKSAIDACVPYKASTALFNGKAVNTYCGLSMYIPHVDNTWVHPYYQSLSWYSAGNAQVIFSWVE